MSGGVVRRRAAVAGFAVVLVLVPGAAGAAYQPVDSPDDLPEPTAEQLATSVRVWDPDGHISPLATESVDGDDTTVTLNADVLFAFGSPEITPDAAAEVAELVAEIPAGTAVSVEGHTDSIGDEQSNLQLSRDRAEAVAEVIRDSDADLRLEVTGLGEAEPVAPNEVGGEDNPQGRSLNRRVEIRYEG